MPTERCGAVSPTNVEVLCQAPATHPNHDHHFAMHKGEPVEWKNPAYVPPPPKRDRRKEKEVKGQVADLASKIRSTTDRSTTSSDTVDRLDGMAQAEQAMEPGFREVAFEAARELSRTQSRWTVDELWDLLDGRGVYTDHPKGMAGLLRAMVSEGIIEPVPQSDPDSHRSSRRTNASRMVQVYESQIREGVLLRNFD